MPETTPAATVFPTTTRLVLLHGLLQTPRIWDEVIDQLVTQGLSRDQVVCPDLSPCLTLDEMADRAREACGAQPATVLGYSMGGYVALALLARAPAAIARLVLLSTTDRPEAPEQQARRETLMALSETDFAAVIDRLIDAGLGEANRGRSDLRARLRQVMSPVHPETYRRHARAVMHRPDRRSLLADARLPVWILHGDSDGVIPVSWSEEMQQRVASSQRREVAGAGHTAPLEQPQTLARLIGECLRHPVA